MISASTLSGTPGYRRCSGGLFKLHFKQSPGLGGVKIFKLRHFVSKRNSQLFKAFLKTSIPQFPKNFQTVPPILFKSLKNFCNGHNDDSSTHAIGEHHHNGMTFVHRIKKEILKSENKKGIKIIKYI